MKSNRILYFVLFILTVSGYSCKSGGKKAPALADDPVFQTEPALRNITEQIKRTPTDAELFFDRANMLRRMGKDTLALNDYKAAISLDSGKSQYYSAIGDLLFETKDLAGSLEWIKKAIRLNPEDRRAHLKIAKMCLYMKNYPEAFKEINVVLRKDVHDPEGYFLKGMVYKDIKDTAKAISNFLTAIQEAPDYRDAMIQLGLLECSRKDSIGLRYLDNAFKLDTSDVFPIYAKGAYYQENKNYAAAKEEYRKCILRNTRFADAYFNMGYILMQEDSVQKAWRQYNLVTKIDPMNPTGYYNRGLCSEMMDSIKNAVADYRMAIAMDTSYSSPKEALRRLKAGKQ